MSRRIGIIGLGNMGFGVAQNLLNAGYKVIGFRRGSMKEFVLAGGIAAKNSLEVLATADVVIECLPSVEALETLITDLSSEAEVVKPNLIVISLGSYPLAIKERFRTTLAEKRIGLIDGELVGTPPMVKNKSVIIYLAGITKLIENVRPICNAISTKTFYLGEFGAASKMKLLANYLLAVHNMAAAEVIALGKKMGIAPNLIVDVIGKGPSSSGMFEIRGPIMISGNFTPAMGPFRTLEKYLHMAKETVSTVGAASPLLDVANHYYGKAMEQGRGDQDIAGIIEIIEAEYRNPP